MLSVIYSGSSPVCKTDGFWTFWGQTKFLESFIVFNKLWTSLLIILILYWACY